MLPSPRQKLSSVQAEAAGTQENQSEIFLAWEMAREIVSGTEVGAQTGEGDWDPFGML